jgi:hypothetical protein
MSVLVPAAVAVILRATEGCVMPAVTTCCAPVSVTAAWMPVVEATVAFAAATV